MKKIFISFVALLIGIDANAAAVRGAANSRYMGAQATNYRAPAQAALVGNVNTTGSGIIVSGTSNTAKQTNTTDEKTTETTDVVAESDTDQEYIDEIKARYIASRNKAAEFCPSISDSLNKIKTMAGITTGASGVGVLGGGTAAVSGFMKSSNDKGLISISDYDKIMAKDGNKDENGQGTDAAAPVVADLLKKFTPEYDNIAKKSETLGTVRTVGSFVAGGADAIGATTSFIALSQFDDLVTAMDDCSAAISEIESEKNELSYAAPDDPMVATMSNLVNNCNGLDSKNISDIKGKLTASGAIVAVSAATGIAGGITSLSKKPNLDMASNILAVATTAGSIAGVVTSAMTLSSLNKNSEVANSCQQMF